MAKRRGAGRGSRGQDWGGRGDWDSESWWGSSGSFGKGRGGFAGDAADQLPFARTALEPMDVVYQCAERVFRNDTDMCTKFDRFVRKAWQSTMKSIADSSEPIPQRVETFVRDWIEDALGRAWQSVVSSYDSPSRLTASMAFDIFKKICRELGILGDKEDWQMRSTRTITAIIRKTWPQYFMKEPCDLQEDVGRSDDDRGRAGGTGRGADGGWRSGGRSEQAPQKQGRDEGRWTTDRAPPHTPKAARESSASDWGSGGRKKWDRDRARGPSSQSPGQSSTMTSGVRLSPRRSESAKKEEAAGGRQKLARSRSGPRSESRGGGGRPAAGEKRKAAEEAGDEAKRRAKAAEVQAGAIAATTEDAGDAAKKPAKASDKGGGEAKRPPKAAAGQAGAAAKQDPEPAKGKVAEAQAAGEAREEKPEQPVRAEASTAGVAESGQPAEADVGGAKADEGQVAEVDAGDTKAEEGEAMGDEDDDFDEDEQDDEALRLLMAKAMEAAAGTASEAVGEQPVVAEASPAEAAADPPAANEGGEVPQDAAKEEETPQAPEAFNIDDIETALKLLAAHPPPKGVRGCGSAEACAGGAGDKLHRFEGYNHTYCAACCRQLKDAYAALQNARLVAA